MKTETIPASPWLFIRWAFVALLFAGTVAIAIDQVKTKENELSSVKAKLEASAKELRETKAKRDEYQSSTLDWMAKAADMAKKGDDLAKAYQRVIDTTKAESDARAARDAALLASQMSQPAAATAYPRQQYNAPIAAPVIPVWYPPAPSVVTKTIRDNAVAEHKDNYASTNYEIERQTEAYEKIIRYHKTADPGIRALINKAALEHGFNYSSFAYEVERQLEASQKLNGR